MSILDYCLNADLKSARRFSGRLSVYVNGGLALVIGLLHYAGTDELATSIFLCALFFWYRTVLTRLSTVVLET